VSTPDHPTHAPDSLKLSRRQLIKTSAAGVVLSSAAFLPGLAKPAWAQKGVVKLGCSLPLSGNFEQVSKLYRSGYEFWSETVKNKMRVGDRELDIEWVWYDDELNPARVAQLTERLITTDKVDFIVGTYGNDTALAQGAVARRYKKIVIQGGGATKRIDEEVGGDVTFTLVAPGEAFGRGALEFLAAQNPKPKRIAVITYDDSAYREITAGIKAAAPGLGMEVVMDIELPLNTQDLRPTVLKMKREGNIDIVYSTGHDVPVIKLIQECAALDFNPKAIIGGHQTTTPSVKNTLKDKLQNVYGVTMWLPQLKYKDPHFASPAEFAEKFKVAKKFDATYHCAVAYTIPLLYELCLRDAKGADPLDNQVVRQKLLAMNGVETIWGPIRFTPKGRIVMTGLPVLQWQGKDPQIQVMHPANLRTAPAVYPTPEWSKRG
jgi:branched-chain amino acid transport system substrate-binding protein